MPSLNELIEKIEAAGGPDQDIDLEIARLQKVVCLRRNADDTANEEFTHWRYTASIDAAMTLIPEGAAWSVTDPANADGSKSIFGRPSRCHAWITGSPNYRDYAATPALALCAAALKARAQTHEPEYSGWVEVVDEGEA